MSHRSVRFVGSHPRSLSWSHNAVGAALVTVIFQWFGVSSLFAAVIEPTHSDALLRFAGVTSPIVTAVSGSAYGYTASVSLFGGPSSTRGPAPVVTLPPGGSAAPITATVPTGLVQYGPAILFSSGPLTVSTQGITGPVGSVTSSTNITGVNTSGQEVFTASNVASASTASATGVIGSTTITNGTLQISEGNPSVAGDEIVVLIPTNPAPNTIYNGRIEGVGDTFRYVFNEQIINPNGSLTVNAAHLYLLGPTAIGELVIGQSISGVTVVPEPAGLIGLAALAALGRRRRYSR